MISSDGTTGEIYGVLVRSLIAVPIVVSGAVSTPSPDTAYDHARIQTAHIAPLYQRGNPIMARRLLNQWIDDTVFHSSPKTILDSKYYSDAKHLRGAMLVDDLLSMLDSEPYHATIALHNLVGTDPIAQCEHGNTTDLVKAWKEWASGRCAEGGSAGEDTEMFSETNENELGAD